MNTETLSEPESNETELVWRLWRQDIYGNQYRMPLKLDSQEQAEDAHAEFTHKGHNQTYTLRQMDPNDETTFIAARD